MIVFTAAAATCSAWLKWQKRKEVTDLLFQVCAVGSRNGTEETKLMVLDFDAEVK